MHTGYTTTVPVLAVHAAHVYHQLVKYSSPNRSNKQKDNSHTKSAYLSENGGLGKRGQENGPKTEDKTETEKE